MKKKNLTIYDIATEADVSIATVSRVLAGKDNVHADTRNRILRIVQRHNFTPNTIAQGLSTKSSRTLGLILPDVLNNFFTKLFAEIQHAAIDSGYAVLLGNTFSDPEIESRLINDFMQRMIDGFFYIGGTLYNKNIGPDVIARINEIQRTKPFVMINGPMSEVNCSTVRSNERDGMRQALEYFFELGHDQIAFLGGLKNVISYEVKIAEYSRILAERGIPLRQDWIINSDYTIEGGKEAFSRLLEAPELPGAIFCVNDLVAIGVMHQAADAGYRIPRHFSLIGFDDTILTEHYLPSISTVAHDYRMLARRAVEVLSGAIQDPAFIDHVVVETKLLIRDSCRPKGIN